MLVVNGTSLMSFIVASVRLGVTSGCNGTSINFNSSRGVGILSSGPRETTSLTGDYKQNEITVNILKC